MSLCLWPVNLTSVSPLFSPCLDGRGWLERPEIQSFPSPGELGSDNPIEGLIN